METLHVLYDSNCGFCVHCRKWLERRPVFLVLEFIPRNSPEVEFRFPGLRRANLPEELVVISDEGGVYHGASAWVMCLYALQEYREWALRLSRPALLPFARRVCELISKNRLVLSRLFRSSLDEEIVEKINTLFPPSQECRWPDSH